MLRSQYCKVNLLRSAQGSAFYTQKLPIEPLIILHFRLCYKLQCITSYLLYFQERLLQYQYAPLNAQLVQQQAALMAATSGPGGAAGQYMTTLPASAAAAAAALNGLTNATIVSPSSGERERDFVIVRIHITSEAVLEVICTWQ